MDDKKINVLIFEDDETLSLALKAALNREGYNAYCAFTVEDAKECMINSNINFLICDCLLPQMPGIEFIEEVRKNKNQGRFETILISGIYTDRSFIEEATQKTQARAFLKKPFEIKDLLKILDQTKDKKEQSTIESSRKNLYEVFSIKKVNSQLKKKLIEEIGEINGFDLPFVFHLILDTQASGHLKISRRDGDVTTVSFAHGSIVNVNVSDERTRIGEMLIHSGYCQPQDVKEGLQAKNRQKLGTYLIQNNRLSPHAFDLIILEQINLRLASEIVDEKITVNFYPEDVEKQIPCVDSDDYLIFMHEWVASKLSIDWLRVLFVSWLDNVISKNATFTVDQPILNSSLIKTLDGISDLLDKKMTLNQLLNVEGYSEVAVFKCIYFLLVKGIVVFEQKANYASPAEHLKTLKKMWRDLEGKNEFQVIMYLEKSGFKAMDSIGDLQAFWRVLGEEPAATEHELHYIWKKVKASVESALEVAGDTTKVDSYREESQRTEAENKILANALMEEVKKMLNLGQSVQASSKFSEVTRLNPRIHQVHIYYSWIKLIQPIPPGKKTEIIKDIELELLQVPPDEKYDAVYSFVSGLVCKLKGDISGAKKSFEKSVGLNASFMPARRELAFIEANYKDFFDIGFKDVFGGLFKK